MRKGLRVQRELPGHKGLKAIQERPVQEGRRDRKGRPVQLLQSVLMGIGIWVLLILGNLPEVQQARKDLRVQRELPGHKGLKAIQERPVQEGRRDRKGRKGRRDLRDRITGVRL